MTDKNQSGRGRDMHNAASGKGQRNLGSGNYCINQTGHTLGMTQQCNV